MAELNKIFCYLFKTLITISLLLLVCCGKKGDLDRPASVDGLEPPEILDDRTYKY